TGTPVPQVGNVATVAAAARTYLHNLHADLAGTGVYAGLVQVASMVGDRDAARYVTEHWDPAMLPEPRPVRASRRPPGGRLGRGSDTPATLTTRSTRPRNPSVDRQAVTSCRM